MNSINPTALPKKVRAELLGRATSEAIASSRANFQLAVGGPPPTSCRYSIGSSVGEA